MPGNIINRTANGVPYLDNDNYLGVYPAYTREIATKIEQVGSPAADVLALLNAANAAKAAAQAAQAAAEAARDQAMIYADTGWLAIPLESGYTTDSDRPAQVRVINSVAVFRGHVIGTFTQNSTIKVGTVPAAARPPLDDRRGHRALHDVSAGLAIAASVQVDGSIYIRRTSATASAAIALSGLSGYTIRP